MCPSAPRVCSEPGGQNPALSLSLDRIVPWSDHYFSSKRTLFFERNRKIAIYSLAYLLQGGIRIQIEMLMGLVREINKSHPGPRETHGKTLDYLTCDLDNDVMDKVHTAREVQHEDDIHRTAAA